MKSVNYITILIGFSLAGLSGCASVPIAKTNCWASQGSTVTSSTKGTSTPTGVTSHATTPVLDDIPCE